VNSLNIGLISDTHGYLDPRVCPHFEGVDHILHAGDIGPRALILELEKVAPVTAVSGNTDFDSTFRETEIIELGSRRFLLHHMVTPSDPHCPIHERSARAKADIVVFGHTHRSYSEMLGNRLYVNPGYAGKQRFNLPRSIAILALEPGGTRTKFIAL
jgi:uncharacterized protein